MWDRQAGDVRVDRWGGLCGWEARGFPVNSCAVPDQARAVQREGRGEANSERQQRGLGLI